MTSIDARELLKEAIADGVDYLPRLKEGLIEIVTMLQQGKEGEGAALFIEVVEGLEWFGTVLMGMKFLDVDESVQKGMSDTTDRYQKALKDLLGAWENRDLVLIGDLLEFEIIPIIDLFFDDILKERKN